MCGLRCHTCAMVANDAAHVWQMQGSCISIQPGLLESWLTETIAVLGSLYKIYMPLLCRLRLGHGTNCPLVRRTYAQSLAIDHVCYICREISQKVQWEHFKKRTVSHVLVCAHKERQLRSYSDLLFTQPWRP